MENLQDEEDELEIVQFHNKKNEVVDTAQTEGETPLNKECQLASSTRVETPCKREEQQATSKEVEAPLEKAAQQANAPTLNVQQQVSAKQPAAAEPEEGCEEEKMCVICLSVPKTHAFVPCGHRCICQRCGDDVLKEATSSCPICRAEAKHVLQIFV